MSVKCDAAPVRFESDEPEDEDIMATARAKLISCWHHILELIDPDETISIIFLILSSNQLVESGHKLCQEIIQGHCKEALETAINLVLQEKGHLNSLLQALYLVGRLDILEDYLDIYLNHNDLLHQKLQLSGSLSLDRKVLYQVFSRLTQKEADQIIVPKLKSKSWSVPEQGRPLEETFIENLKPGNYSRIINEIYHILKDMQYDKIVFYLDQFLTSDELTAPSIQENDFYEKAHQFPFGLCVIINVKDFRKTCGPQDKITLSKRYGSDIDQERLTGTFKLFGFEIRYLKNPSYNELRQFFQKISNDQKLCKIACLAVCVMTHGDGVDNIYLHDRNSISVTDLRKLCFCESLLNKPRLYFVQACRDGKMRQSVIKLPGGFINREADCLISYATVPGHTAIRSQSEGSWYITDLCRSLQEYGHVRPIEYVLRKTRESIKNRREQLGEEYVTQFSEDKVTLLKGIQLQRADLDSFVSGITDLVEMKVKDSIINQSLDDDDIIQQWIETQQPIMNESQKT